MEDEDLRFLQPYFARVQAIDANVFDLSVTMVHPATNAEAFRPHYDITLSDHIKHRASIGGLTVRASLWWESTCCFEGQMLLAAAAEATSAHCDRTQLDASTQCVSFGELLLSTCRMA